MHFGQWASGVFNFLFISVQLCVLIMSSGCLDGCAYGAASCCFLLWFCSLYGLSSRLCMSVRMHVKGQKVDGYRHVFPDILRCFCKCAHWWLIVCLQAQRRLEQQINVQRLALCFTGIFLESCFTVGQTTKRTYFTKPVFFWSG